MSALFALMFVLDMVFGLHYDPEEQQVDKPKKEKVERPTQIQTASLDENKEERNDLLQAGFIDSVPVEEEVAPANDEKEEKEEEAEENEEIYFENLKKQYQSEILENLPARKSRTDITIRYYRHPPDGKSAYALEKLGFYIHERPVDPSHENFQSNAIFYGDSVRLSDIQLVAYTLLKEGLPIKTIMRSKFGNSWKSHSIEIGTDSTLVSERTLTLTEIQNLSL